MSELRKVLSVEEHNQLLDDIRRDLNELHMLIQSDITVYHDEQEYSRMIYQDLLAAYDKLHSELTQYREMFEGLRVEEECDHNVISAGWCGYYCPICKGDYNSTGKLHRPLTMEEMKELHVELVRFHYYNNKSVMLSSGVKVVKV